MVGKRAIVARELKHTEVFMPWLSVLPCASYFSVRQDAALK